MTPAHPAAEEVAQFSESVRGTLSRGWVSPLVAGEPDAGARGLAEVWATGAAQGWTDLSDPGLLPFVLAALGELGRVACPLPLMDAFVASELLAAEPELVAAIASGTVRPVVGTGGPGELRFVDGAQAATHVLVAPDPTGTVELRAVDEARPTPGLAAPP